MVPLVVLCLKMYAFEEKFEKSLEGSAFLEIDNIIKEETL